MVHLHDRHGNVFTFSKLLRPWQKWTDEHVQKSCARWEWATSALRSSPLFEGLKVTRFRRNAAEEHAISAGELHPGGA